MHVALVSLIEGCWRINILIIVPKYGNIYILLDLGYWIRTFVWFLISILIFVAH